MVTLKDVAKKAGVSPSTVSRVLNNKMKVMPETKQRIVNTVEEMGYRVNEIAKGLRTSRTRTLGLILPTISNAYYTELSRGVEEYASLHGYNVFLCNSRRDINIQRNYIDTLLSKKIDGLIVTTFELEQEDIHLLLENKIAVVFNGRTKSSGIDEVGIDHAEASYEMTKYLLGLGHERIALINGPFDSKRNQSRVKGFKKAHQDIGITVYEELIKYSDYSAENSFAIANELLKLKNRPTCIFTTDNMALGVLNAAFDNGLKVPSDLSVAGFDNAVFTRPSLTTIYHPNYDMGKTMARLAISRINSERSIPKRSIILKTKLIKGNSTTSI